ncbi:MAG: thiolase family protein [Dehalococcoidia bacterium]|nr:thiolase family protein [Dehalococcoidia bacterium]
MREVAVSGVSMTRFGKYMEKGLRELSAEVILGAANDAGIDLKDIQFASVGNSLAGLITGQESVRGQVILKEVGLGGIPVTNVENACATSSTAFFECWMAVASGYCDVALALGVEKLFCGDTARSNAALATCIDVDVEGRMGFSFLGWYAAEARSHMETYGTTQEQMAKVSVKSHKNGSLNPYAQYQKEVSIEEVLSSRPIAWPITLLMCAPIGDGAAAAILTSKDIARRHTSEPITIASSELTSGRILDCRRAESAGALTEMLAKKSYEKSGIGPEDLGVVELHDAFSPAEISIYEDLGLCNRGEGGRLVDEGKTEIGGTIPVNTSGGLAAKGHPVGATGIAMITEIVWQLRGLAGKRQVEPRPKVGLVQNGGGLVAGEYAADAIHILKR